MFLGRNFWTRNAKKPIKDPKYSDYSLVSNKNFNQKMALGVGAQAPVTWAKKAWNLPHSSHKKRHPKLSIKKSQLEDLPHFWGFEQLSSSIAWQVMVLQSGTKIVANAGSQSVSISYTSSQRVTEKQKSIKLLIDNW